MKHLMRAALVASALACGSPAGAQIAGQFTGADPLAPNAHLFGAYLLTSENTAGLMSQLRLSFYQNVDFGFQGGLVRRDLDLGHRTTLKLGGDLKTRLTTGGQSFPLSVSLGAALGVETGDNVSVLTLGPTVVGSRTMAISQTVAWTPYASLGITYSKFSIGETDDTDTALPLRLGIDFKANAALDLVLEFQANMDDRLNDDTGLALGVNLPF